MGPALGRPGADPRVPACMSAAERKWPWAVSMGKLRLGSGLGQLASTGPAFFLWLPVFPGAWGQTLGSSTLPCCWDARGALQPSLHVQNVCRPEEALGPRGPQVALCPMSFHSGSLETVWAAPGSSAWASEAHLPVAWVRAHALLAGGDRVQLALLRLGHAWRSGLALGGGPGPSAVGEARAVSGGRGGRPG